MSQRKAALLPAPEGRGSLRPVSCMFSGACASGPVVVWESLTLHQCFFLERPLCVDSLKGLALSEELLASTKKILSR